jgi:hypothetical protein
MCSYYPESIKNTTVYNCGSSVIARDCFEIVAKNEIKECSSTNNSDSCFENLALNIFNNSNFCWYIQFNDASINKKDQCYLSLALSKKEVSSCDEIWWLPKKYECYTSLASEKKDSSICSKIPISFDRNGCINKSI